VINDVTLRLIIQAVDLATKDIDGVHEKLQQLGDELTKNEFSRSAEGMQAFSDSVKGATQPLADAAKNTLALSAAITGVASFMAGQAYQSAVSYESALADLAKVIDGGMDSAKGYGQQLNQMALQYSQNGQELVQAMANFVQAGYDADEAFRLVEQSVKLMIAGELEAGDASQQLVSILKGFKEPADQAGRAVDILNEVSNKYATNVNELATGMAAISPIAKQMGFSMEETAGLLTPVIEVFQSGSEAADALKTGLQRLTDNTTPVKDALASIGVSQLDLNGNMRSGRDVFLDVARSMVGLTEAQKSFVVQQLVGVDQAGRMTQVFDNLAVYLGVTNTALDSTGSALKEVNTRLETSEASNKRAAESWRQLGVTLGNTLKPQITGVIDATGNLAKAFDGAVKSGDLAPLLNVIKPQVAAVENLFQAMAANMQGALAGVDWTPLVNGIKELSGEFGEAFAALTDGMDLMTQSGLQTFLQNLINLLGNFTQYVAGIVDGLEPFIDGLNVLFKAVSTNLPEFSKLIGQIQGLSLSINQGLPFILEWGNRIFGVVGAIVDWTVKIGLLIGAFKLLTAAGIPVGAMLTGLVTQFLALNPAIAGVLAGLAGMPGLVLALVAAAGGLGVALGGGVGVHGPASSPVRGRVGVGLGVTLGVHVDQAPPSPVR
jgi:TP901 family phage tail tape measure protein